MPAHHTPALPCLNVEANTALHWPHLFKSFAKNLKTLKRNGGYNTFVKKLKVAKRNEDFN